MIDYYRQEATRRAGQEFRLALSTIEAAARAGRVTLGPDAFAESGVSIDAIKASPLVGRILQPSPFRPDLFEIDPFILGAWRERLGEEER